jgi:hypothetical protein
MILDLGYDAADLNLPAIIPTWGYPRGYPKVPKGQAIPSQDYP